MLTTEQIQNFIVKAQAAGFSEQEIRAEIQRKQAEVTQPAQQPNQGMPNQGATQQIPAQQPMQQPAAPQPQMSTQPAAPQVVIQQPAAQEAPQEKESFAKRFIKSIVAPAEKYARFVGEAGYQAKQQLVSGGEISSLREKVNAGTATPEEIKRLQELVSPRFMKADDFNRTATTEGLVEETVQAAAGGMSVPLSVTNPVLGGGAAALATSEEETAAGLTKDFAIGAATAKIIDGAFSIAAKKAAPALQAVTRKLSAAAEDIQLGSYVKAVGAKPINKFGGRDLLQNMKKLGFAVGDADSIITQADEVITKNNGVVDAITQELGEKGVKVDITNWVKTLEKDVNSSMLKSDKAAKQAVIDEIKEITGDSIGKIEIDPNQFYKLKQALGTKGRWTSNADPATQVAAQTYRKAYTEANSVLDDALKQNGFSDFRGINDALHTAMNAKGWAEYVANKAPNINQFGLLDTMTGIGFTAGTGNPVTGAAAIAGRRIINSAPVRKVAGKVLEKGTQLTEAGVPEAVQKTAQAARKPVTATIGRVASDFSNLAEVGQAIASQRIEENVALPTEPTSAVPTAPSMPTEMTPPAPEPQASNVFGGKTKQQILLEAQAQGASFDDLQEISDTYDLLSGGGAAEIDTKAATDLRTEYFKRTNENDFLEVTNSYNKLAGAPNTSAGDVSLIFAYMKMLDPGSVVREGEFATAEQTAGIPDRIRNQYNKALKGKRLGDEQRQEFINAGYAVYQTYAQKQAQIDQFYNNLAQQYGVDPQLLGIGTFGGATQ